MLLAQEVKRLDSVKGWNPAFQMLNLETKKFVEHLTLKAARLPDNRNRNRYRDILPYDQSRIVLNSVKDYINANLVEVPEINRKYILTQGPLEHTCSHFWQMVWEQKSMAVVMLNRIVEKNTIKCHPYWPMGEDEVAEYGTFRVKNQSEQMASAYVVRDFQLENLTTGDTRTVKHFHYMLWPDFGVPASPDSFLEFLQDVRESGGMDESSGPPIVHCSAGVGRSGTFCLVDSALAKVEKDDSYEKLDVRQMLLDLRRYRVGLIQTAEQLRFSYIAIIEGIKRLYPEQFEDEGVESGNDGQDIGTPEEDTPPPLPPRRPPPISKALPELPPEPNKLTLAQEQARQKRLVESLNSLDSSPEESQEEDSELSDSEEDADLEDVQLVLDHKGSPPRKPLPPLPPGAEEDATQVGDKAGGEATKKPLPAAPLGADAEAVGQRLDHEGYPPGKKKKRNDDSDDDRPSTARSVSADSLSQDDESVTVRSGEKASEDTEVRRRHREQRRVKTNELVTSIKRRLKEEEISIARRRLWTKTAVAVGICAGIFFVIHCLS